MRWPGLAAVFVSVTLASPAGALPLKAARARVAILGLELDEAERILGTDDESPDVVVERARLAIYRADCDTAVELLELPDLEDEEDYPFLYEIAKGCARASAATVIVEDRERGVWVRFQDDADRALFPLIADNVVRMRDVLEKDLGKRLPDPVRIDLLRDQLSLSAHSGLPERSAQTTGTVAVAKWGRVMMLSPRASSRGYPWLDTLAHEMTHLVLSQATRDKAPLWLQEGVAKREETRWRTPSPFDGVPSPDDVAFDGIQNNLGLPLNGLGPSIAMLPSPEQAAIAFAEVSSFINYWVEENGPEALPKLLSAVEGQLPGADVSDAIKSVSGASLAEWDLRWRAHLETVAKPLPPEHALTRAVPNAAEVSRRRRLGELLLGREHFAAAAAELKQGHALMPREASVRCLHGDALRGLGEEVPAGALFADPKDIFGPTARWWSLHAAYELTHALPDANLHALGHNPMDPRVACQERPWGELPSDPLQRAICEMAWQTPAWRNLP